MDFLICIGLITLLLFTGALWGILLTIEYLKNKNKEK